MIQRKKKQLRILILAILIIALISTGIWGISTALKNKTQTVENAQSDTIDFQLKRLIVETRLAKE